MYSYGQCFDIRLNASRSLNPGAPKMVKPYRLDKAALNMQATQQTLVSMRIGEWQIDRPAALMCKSASRSELVEM